MRSWESLFELFFGTELEREWAPKLSCMLDSWVQHSWAHNWTSLWLRSHGWYRTDNHIVCLTGWIPGVNLSIRIKDPPAPHPQRMLSPCWLPSLLPPPPSPLLYAVCGWESLIRSDWFLDTTFILQLQVTFRKCRRFYLFQCVKKGPRSLAGP